jgi:hypothetical protein
MPDSRIVDEIRRAVRNAVAAEPNVMLNRLAERFGLSEGVVAAFLDADMCTVIPPHAFERIWECMSRWEKVTFIAVAPGAITEISGRLPRGKLGRRMFNFGEAGCPLAGHIRVDELKQVCLVSKPFMGLESHSARFYNHNGDLMFAVYVGRNGKTLIPSVREGFLNLRKWAEREEIY